MRFLLINPYYSISETPSPPLGLAYLAAVLEHAGIEVKILDFVVYPYSRQYLETELKRFAPQVVGSTAVTMSFDNAIELIETVKEIDAEIITVLGGPHVTFCADETLRRYSGLDVIVRGEGETTIVDLADAIAQGRHWDHIKGITYRDGGDIVTNGNRLFLDVNTLPIPARHYIPMGRYRALGMPVSMITSRGCPFKCIFCVGRKMVGSRVRYRSPRKVVDEMEYLHTLDFHQINLADDLFTANPAHCLAVCDEIDRRKLDIQWTSFARVDTVSLDLLIRMKKAGCTAVSFGVESGNAAMLKRIRKGITLEQVVDAVNTCNSAEIIPHASFILGLPGETPESLEESIAFGEKLKDMGVSHGFHLLAPFPGTVVREEIDRYDLTILTHEWSRYHANRAIVKTSAVTPDMLDAVVIAWEEKFDEWLGILDKKYKSGEASEAEAWPLLKLEHTVLLYDVMMARALETKGVWAVSEHPAAEGEMIGKLTRKLAGTVKYSPEKIAVTLQYAYSQNYIRPVQKKDAIRWEWNDYL